MIPLSDLVRKYAGIYDFNQRNCRSIIADIRVHTGGGLKIVFKFEDELNN